MGFFLTENSAIPPGGASRYGYGTGKGTYMAGKTFNRRLALAGGAAAAAGLGYLALRKPKKADGRRAPEIGTFNRGNAAEPGTLDPSMASGTAEDAIMGDMLVGLMTNSDKGRPIPGMAKSWTSSTDGLTWTFKLRDAKWSDGQPVTAEDFAFAWRRILDPATAASYAYFLYVLKNAEPVNKGRMPINALGVQTPDSHTLEIQLEHPAPYLLEMLMHMTMFPLPRHVVTAKGKEWTKPGNYVANGAYVLKEWVANDHVTLVKNPHFYDAANVAIERTIFYPTTDYGAAFRRLRAGELDTQDRLPGEQIEWIRANMPELLNPVPQLIIDLLAVNHKRPPFNDVRVRAALNMAINRDVITKKISRVGNLPAYNLVPPTTANYPGGQMPDYFATSMEKRMAQAQQLMREAGYGQNNRLSTTLMLRSTAPGTSRAIAAALQQMFALIYVNVTITPADAAIFYDKIQEHDFDIAWPGWHADFNDASNFLDLLITDSGNNWGGYSNKAFDAALAAAQNDPDLASRGRKLAQAEAIALKDHAVMPLYFWVSGSLVRPYMKGWITNENDINRTRWVSIDEEARAALFK